MRSADQSPGWTHNKPTDIDTDTLAAMFPARRVEIPTQTKLLVVEVRPITLADIHTWQDAVVELIQRGGPLLVDIHRQAKDDEFIPKVIDTLMPFVLGRLLGLVNECCSVDISRLPHYVVAPIVEAFMLESFGDPKAREPWITLGTRVMTMVEQGSLSESNSQPSAPADSQNQTSEASRSGASG